MMALFAALSDRTKTYLLCNFSIFLFSAFTKRLVGCFYKCGCVVKFSILMSTMRKIHFSSREGQARTQSFTVSLMCSRDNNPVFSKINPGWKLYLGPFLKSDRNPLSGIQARLPVTTWPACGYRNGECVQELEDWIELRTQCQKWLGCSWKWYF